MLNFGSGIPNLPVWEVAQNQNIKFEVYDGKVTITTKVLDKDGKILVQIEHNHWTTPEVPQILDWNYADDALEVIGPSGRVVLQIKVLGDRFQIAGEWWDENGRGQRWVKVPYGAEMLILVRTNDPDEQHIVPLFQYPSTRHLGKLVRTQNNDPPSYVQVMLIFIAVYALGVFSCPIALFALWLQER